MSVPVTLSNIKRWDVKGRIFTADLRNYAHTFDLEQPSLIL